MVARRTVCRLPEAMLGMLLVAGAVLPGFEPRQLAAQEPGRSAGDVLPLVAPAGTPREATSLPATGAALDPQHARKMARGMQLFKSTVRPLLVNHCLDCHGGETVESELDISTRKGLLRGGSRGPAVLLDRPEESLLLQLVNHQREPHMPEGEDLLPEKDRKALALWISLGAPYDRPLREGGPVQTHWSQKRIRPEDRQHWAWLPLGRPRLPQVRFSR